jgi:hypothetical protein
MSLSVPQNIWCWMVCELGKTQKETIVTVLIELKKSTKASLRILGAPAEIRAEHLLLQVIRVTAWATLPSVEYGNNVVPARRCKSTYIAYAVSVAMQKDSYLHKKICLNPQSFLMIKWNFTGKVRSWSLITMVAPETYVWNQLEDGLIYKSKHVAAKHTFTRWYRRFYDTKLLHVDRKSGRFIVRLSLCRVHEYNLCNKRYTEWF